MKLPETGPVRGELADTEHGEADLPREAARLYRRLRVLAGLLREAPPGGAARLLWRDEGGRVQARVIEGEVVIGRDHTCDIVLTPPWVSRRHCRVWLKTREAWVEDLGSTAGTGVNGCTTSRQSLHEGDFIEIGGLPIAYIGGL